MAKRNPWKRFSPIILVIMALAVPPDPALAAQPKDYSFVVLRGQLSDPARKKPMMEATIRVFEIVDSALEEPREFEAVTDNEGRFEFPKLPLSRFRMEIETREGEFIRGIDVVELNNPDMARLKLRISKRIVSDTLLVPGTDRFFVGVIVDPTKWKKFWKEAGAFLGLTTLLGLGI